MFQFGRHTKSPPVLAGKPCRNASLPFRRVAAFFTFFSIALACNGSIAYLEVIDIYPKRKTMTNTEFETLKDDFEFIDDWEERYKYVIELGKNMTALPESEYSEQLKVHGCVSQVWIKTEFLIDDDGTKRLHFLGDSDAMIVRGLVAVLRILMHDRPVQEIVKLDAVAALAELGLNDHLTPQRSNGLNSMIKRLQSDAAQAAG